MPTRLDSIKNALDFDGRDVMTVHEDDLTWLITGVELAAKARAAGKAYYANKNMAKKQELLMAAKAAEEALDRHLSQEDGGLFS